jgi:hypothetical protein
MSFPSTVLSDRAKERNRKHCSCHMLDTEKKVHTNKTGFLTLACRHLELGNSLLCRCPMRCRWLVATSPKVLRCEDRVVVLSPTLNYWTTATCFHGFDQCCALMTGRNSYLTRVLSCTPTHTVNLLLDGSTWKTLRHLISLLNIILYSGIQAENSPAFFFTPISTVNYLYPLCYPMILP